MECDAGGAQTPSLRSRAATASSGAPDFGPATQSQKVKTIGLRCLTRILDIPGSH